jgi:hypothetical protein
LLFIKNDDDSQLLGAVKIPATQEAETKKTQVRSQPRQIV